MKMAKSVLAIFGFLHLCVSSAIADGAGLEWKILTLRRKYLGKRFPIVSVILAIT